jgi:hypothetical protein
MSRQPPSPGSLFEDAIDIPLWLEQDRDTDLRARLQRDRRLGLDIRARQPLRRVRAWWQRLDVRDRPDAGHRLQRARILVGLTLASAGIVVGAGVTLAVFRYEGDYPVNVVAALALLAGLPFAMALLTLLLLPGRVPGLRALQDAIAAINVGNLATSLFNRLARAVASDRRSDPTPFELGWPAARSGAAARFARWQLLYWSQWFGVCYSIGALSTAFLLVVFTDLAFGWSTTLDVEATRAQRIAEVIATPWAFWLPAAVPDAALVADSRYFRLEGVPRTQIPAGRLTGWWPFVLMALIVYGLLPRVLLLALARWRLAAATRALLLDDTAVRALLDRMDTAVLESSANGGDDAPDASPAVREGDGEVRIAERARVLVWNRALDDAELERWRARWLGRGARQVVHAGGRSIEADEAALDMLEPNDHTMLLVLTKSWEPPMLDFIDFVGRLRDRVGRATSIVVVPVGLGGEPPDALAVGTWRQALARHPDAGVYVQELSR